MSSGTIIIVVKRKKLLKSTSTCLCNILSSNMTSFAILISSRDFSFKCSSPAMLSLTEQSWQKFSNLSVNILDCIHISRAMRRLNLSGTDKYSEEQVCIMMRLGAMFKRYLWKERRLSIHNSRSRQNYLRCTTWSFTVYWISRLFLPRCKTSHFSKFSFIWHDVSQWWRADISLSKRWHCSMLSARL